MKKVEKIHPATTDLFPSSEVYQIFEKIIQKRSKRYLENCFLLTENQCSFRKEKDADQAATTLWKLIQSNWATKTHSMGNFFDFRKAFCTVDYEIILQNLRNLGVRGNVHALTTSYLANRKQFMNVNS